MRYRNRVIRVCNENCHSKINGTCLLYSSKLFTIEINKINYCVAVPDCLYKKNKAKEDDTVSLFKDDTN